MTSPLALLRVGERTVKQVKKTDSTTANESTTDGHGPSLAPYTPLSATGPMRFVNSPIGQSECRLADAVDTLKQTEPTDPQIVQYGSRETWPG